MHPILAVPEAMVESLRAYVAAEALPLTVNTGNQGTVRVVESSEGNQSTPSELHAGGWIACRTAFELAERLGLRPREAGKLVDHLNIRIRACQLGCFE